MPMDQNGPLECTEEDPQGATGWRSPPDPTDKQTDREDQIVFPALELMSGPGMRKQPPAKRGMCLQVSQTKRVQEIQ